MGSARGALRFPVLSQGGAWLMPHDQCEAANSIAHRDVTCFNNVYTCTACCSSGSVLGASGRIVTCWDSVFTPSR
jgi:hypothetical protein